MVFGRKKNETVVVDVDEENDLALAYGTPELDESKDDSSTEDSIPPPPPDLGAGENTKQNTTHDDSMSDDGQSVEATQYEFSMLTDLKSSTEEEKEEDPNNRKKIVLILLCAASFFVLLGLSIKYGMSRNQSKNGASLNSVEENANENGSFDSPIMEDPTTATEEVVGEEYTPEEEMGAITNTAEVEVDTTPTEGVDQVPAVAEQTLAPSNDNTQIGTLIVSNIETTVPSDANSNEVTSQGLFKDCIADEISVATGCDENGVTFVGMDFCLANDVSDEFWAWIDTPQSYAQFVISDWEWLRDGAEREDFGLPEGTYVLGLFSNGQQVLTEYPLITSTEFTISCSA